ncbi:hypothetical protein BSLG_002277 [Batrachochytrium salamandrivorans]|nr:hypothetical protein BSLG_002277 [Batrachochytrium salamandrivorans]
MSPINESIAKAVYQQDPALEGLVQEFAMRMAQQDHRNSNSKDMDLLHEQRKDSDFIDIDTLPGFVFKTKTLQATDDYPLNMKVFVNICHSPEVPQPPPISDVDLRNLVANMDSSTYRIPLSLSPPRSDLDKGGQVCIVFDVCVNSAPFARTVKDDYFRSFLVLMAIAWIEQKHTLSLSEDFILPKMRTKGKLVRHTVRKYRKPFISEVSSSPSSNQNSLLDDNSSPTSELLPEPSLAHNPPAVPQKQSIVVPNYNIILEPEVGHPEYIVIRVELPLSESIGKAGLDIEADRLLFSDHIHYELDIVLPFSIDIDEAGAQFNRQTRILSITASVLAVVSTSMHSHNAPFK